MIDREGRVVARVRRGGERGGRARRSYARRSPTRCREARRSQLSSSRSCSRPAAYGLRRRRPPTSSRELVCPVCETTLDQSNAPIAERMKAFIRTRIAAGDCEQEIKAALVVAVRRRACSRSRPTAASACSRGSSRSLRSSAGAVACGAPHPGLEPARGRRRPRRTSRSTRSSSASSTRSSRGSTLT